MYLPNTVNMLFHSIRHSHFEIYNEKNHHIDETCVVSVHIADCSIHPSRHFAFGHEMNRENRKQWV